MFKIENLYDVQNVEVISHIKDAKAHVTLQRDVDYMVVDGEVLIVDQFTGRTMPGRRFLKASPSDRSKEGVKIQNESKQWHPLLPKLFPYV